MLLMVTNLLAEIRDKLKAIASSIDSDFASLESAITALNDLIAGLEAKIDEIVEDVDTIATNTTNILIDTGEIVDATQNIDTSTQTISNHTYAIMTSSGTTAAYAEDIATNTLESKNLCSSMAADTTEIIALLRQLVAGGGGDMNFKMVTSRLTNLNLPAGGRQKYTFAFNNVAEDEQIYAIKAVSTESPTDGSDTTDNYKRMLIQGFNTTNNNTKYACAFVNPIDVPVSFDVQVQALVGKKGE